MTLYPKRRAETVDLSREPAFTGQSPKTLGRRQDPPSSLRWFDGLEGESRSSTRLRVGDVRAMRTLSVRPLGDRHASVPVFRVRLHGWIRERAESARLDAQRQAPSLIEMIRT
jgi:hypothetical protein